MRARLLRAGGAARRGRDRAPMSARAAERGALAAMVGATLLWGGTFVAIRDSVAGVPPAMLVAWRFTAAGALFTIVLLLRRRLPSRHDVTGGFLSGLLMVGGFYFQAVGLRTAAAGTSAFLTCTGTLLAAFWAWPLLGQRPGRRLVAGIALAMAGSALLSLRGAGFTLGTGEVWTLAGAALFALQVVAVARFAAGADPVALVCVQSFTAAAILMPFAGTPHAAAELFAGADRWRFVYLAVAGSTIAPLLQVHAQRTLSAGRIGLLFALEPVFALLFALTLGGERFGGHWWAGATLILAAVALVEWRPGAGVATA
jgi:drug/metabolite transporter (DMT)-like permease